MEWQIIDTGKASAEKNMVIDKALLQDLKHTKQPILHLYDWDKPAATFGHFLDPYKYLKKEKIIEHGLDLAKRPTGGGIIFHLSDFAFSILIPASHPNCSLKTLDNYAFVNGLIAKVIQNALNLEETPQLLDHEPTASHPNAHFFCMAKPTQNDVMWKGKKLSGGAQRRTKYGFLHQGTISMDLPPLSLLKMLLINEGIEKDMETNTCIFKGTQAHLFSAFHRINEFIYFPS